MADKEFSFSNYTIAYSQKFYWLSPLPQFAYAKMTSTLPNWMDTLNFEVCSTICLSGFFASHEDIRNEIPCKFLMIRSEWIKHKISLKKFDLPQKKSIINVEEILSQNLIDSHQKNVIQEVG